MIKIIQEYCRIDIAHSNHIIGYRYESVTKQMVKVVCPGKVRSLVTTLAITKGYDYLAVVYICYLLIM